MSRRILIVNKFMYPRGGDCIVALNTRALLEKAGYEVAVWAMDYPENIASEHSGLYASRVDFAGGVGAKLAAARRSLGLGDIRESFGRMLREFHPDTVHFNNIHSYLSPVIVEMAHKAGARTLWTLHDYKLACPSYLCLRQGKVCTECIDNPRAVVTHRCMKGSLAASLLGWAEARRWNVGRLCRSTDMFICPSEFMASMMRRAGVPESKLAVITNFVDPQKLAALASLPADRRGDYYAYVGRLSAEKGVDRLLEVAAALPYPLRVYGSGPLESELRQRYGSDTHISFMGHADAATVADAIAGARLTVIPSQWYENNPLSVIESLCAGTPVAGSRIGGIPELIASPADGRLFAPDSPAEMRGAIEALYAAPTDHASLKARAQERFSPEAHLQALEQLL